MAMPYLDLFLTATERVPKAIVTLLDAEATSLVLQRFAIKTQAVVARVPGIRPKPHPDPVIHALKLLCAEPDGAVMVGDSEWDEKAAEAAGVRFIAVTNGRQNHNFKTPYIASNLKEAAKLIQEL